MDSLFVENGSCFSVLFSLCISIKSGLPTVHCECYAVETLDFVISPCRGLIFVDCFNKQLTYLDSNENSWLWDSILSLTSVLLALTGLVGVTLDHAMCFRG